MKQFLSFLFLSLSFYVFSKDYRISVTIEGFSYQKLYVLKLYGDKVSLKDSVMTDGKGEATVLFSDNDHTGVYQFSFEDDKTIDFIFNKEVVTIQTSYLDYKNRIRVVESVENKLYYAFQRLQHQNSQKLEILTYVLDNYSNSGSYYKSTLAEYESVRNNLSKGIDSILSTGKNTFAARLIKSERTVVAPASLSAKQRDIFYKSHYFDNVDFSDTTLFYSDIFTGKVISYLGLWSSRNLSKDQLTKIYKMAVDSVISKTINYKKSFDFIFNYMINGFETMQYTELLMYLSDTYIALNSCETKTEKTTLERKVLYHKKLSIGQPVPDFSLVSVNNETINLKDIKDKYIILFFWSTECPHCQESLPMIQKISDALKKEKAQLIPIALDEKVEEMLTFIKNKNYHLSSLICDGKGWESEIVLNYFIYATPTIIVIKDGKVVQKPLELRVLIDYLGSKGVL